MPAVPRNRPGADARRRPETSGLRPLDLVRMAVDGLRARATRTTLTAVGIAVGIGSIVAVIGISASSRAEVLAELDRLGTNLLAVQAKSSLVPGQATGLPDNAAGRMGRIGAVEQQAALHNLDVAVARNDLMSPGRNGGVTTAATDSTLADTLAATLSAGRFLDDADGDLPRAVLGSQAAQRLGIDRIGHRPTVAIDGHRVAVVGILEPLPLNPDIDRMVLIRPEMASSILDDASPPDMVFARVAPDYVEAVSALAARTISPTDPEAVVVSRPSEALEVQAAVDRTLTALLIGLGSVALLVGAIGIANVMVIAVVERRVEIGVRRALGATRTHIALQFVSESTVLAAMGGGAGIALGVAAATGFSSYRGWAIDIPIQGLAASALGALIVGAVAGLYPAVRASRLDPAEAVRARP